MRLENCANSSSKLTSSTQKEEVGAENKRIHRNGRYQRDALNMLMMRAWFLIDVLMDRSLLKNGLPTPGHVRDAIEILDQVQWIAKLPFNGHIMFEYNMENIAPVIPALKMDPVKLQMKDEFDQRLANTWSETLVKARKGLSRAKQDKAVAGSLPQASSEEWESLIRTIAKRVEKSQTHK